jgi:uncharacterized membrane protein
VSLQTGKKLGFFSSLVFVIVPPVAIALLLTFIVSIISTIQLNGLNGSNLPPGLGGIAIFGAGLGITMVLLAILSLIALILLIIAMNYLSKYYNTPGIFTNILYAVIINIVSVVVVFALSFALLVPASRNISTSGTIPTSGDLGGVFTGLIAVVVVAAVMSIISAVLVWRSFNLLGEKSEVDSFKTAGLLYLIGVLLSIIVVGAIIAWIAFIFAALGFRRLKPLPSATTPVTYPPQASTPTTIIETKRCPYCQTENRIDATYCRFCGKSLT